MAKSHRKRIVGSRGDHKRSCVSQMRFDCHGDCGINDAERKFGKGITCARRDNEKVKQLFRPDLFGFRNAFDALCAAEGFNLLHDGGGTSEARVGVLYGFAENGGDMIAVKKLCHDIFGFGKCAE